MRVARDFGVSTLLDDLLEPLPRTRPRYEGAITGGPPSRSPTR